jgi:hypothetical protein|tara:strand:- start:136 stop:642 length:507 start_codon:yes stop_codon:yes gene_type:complete
MNPQQLHDLIIKPTLEYMGGNYYSKESAFLLLCTAAIESDCGYYIKQINGPALGIWQMEPSTEDDIWQNCDALDDSPFISVIGDLHLSKDDRVGYNGLIESSKYACAMARLKYSMDPNPLPKLTGDNNADSRAFYDYYKRVYNTELGASTFDKWAVALKKHRIFEVEL